MNGMIASKRMIVTVQENGIVREETTGLMIARLLDEIVYDRLQAMERNKEIISLVKPEVAEDELNNFKDKLIRIHANMVTYFKPKENQVILDFIATISKEDLG